MLLLPMLLLLCCVLLCAVCCRWITWSISCRWAHSRGGPAHP